jgi:hypothetical protein
VWISDNLCSRKSYFYVLDIFSWDFNHSIYFVRVNTLLYSWTLSFVCSEIVLIRAIYIFSEVFSFLKLFKSLFCSSDNDLYLATSSATFLISDWCSWFLTSFMFYFNFYRLDLVLFRSLLLVSRCPSISVILFFNKDSFYLAI